MNFGKTKKCWSHFIRSGEGLNIWTKLVKAREVEVEGEEETGIDVDGGAEVGMGRWGFGPERRGMEVEETLIEGAGRGEEGRRRMQSFVLEGFWGRGGFTKNLEILVVVDEILDGRDTIEEVEGGGGGFTTGVNTLEEREVGGGSTSLLVR